MTILVFVAGFFCGGFTGVLILVIVGNKIIRANLGAQAAAKVKNPNVGQWN